MPLTRCSSWPWARRWPARFMATHISPISDTTILSSAGAKCNHLRHVATQIPYATLVMIVCFVGYVIAGFTKSPWISLALGVVLIAIAVLVLVRTEASKKAKA